MTTMIDLGGVLFEDDLELDEILDRPISPIYDMMSGDLVEVSCEEDDVSYNKCHEPILTFSVARRLKKMSAKEAQKKFGHLEPHLTAWLLALPAMNLRVVIDPDKPYMREQVDGLFSDENAEMVHYMDLVLPPEALQRLLEIRKRKDRRR